MKKINLYSLFAQACIIFTFTTFVGFMIGYLWARLGYASFTSFTTPVYAAKIVLIFFYFLLSFILTIHHQVGRFHLFLLVIVADLLSNFFGIGKPNYFPQIFLFNIMIYSILMFLGNYLGKKYLSKQIK